MRKEWMKQFQTGLGDNIINGGGVFSPGMMPSRLVLAATRVLIRMLLSRRGGVSARIPLGQ